MSPENEKIWNEAFRAGIKEIQNALNEELKDTNKNSSEIRQWIGTFLDKNKNKYFN